MPGILDIAPPEVLRETVTISRTDGAGKVTSSELVVRGIDAATFALILKRFPEFRKEVAGMVVPADVSLMTKMDMVPAYIAAGLGYYGDEAIEDAVSARP